MPEDGSAAPDGFATADPADVTFAELFAEMRSPETSGDARGAVAIAAPPQVPAAAGEAAPQTAVSPDLPYTVVPARPTLVIREVDPAMAEQVQQTPGVSAAAAATIRSLDLDIPGGSQTITIAAVDPEDFRPLTPVITAQERGVWERLSAGDAAFTHDAGTRLALPLGTTVALDGRGAAPQAPASAAGAPGLRVGALASNGIPSVADALVSIDRADELGVVGRGDIYVALDASAVESEVIAALEALTGGTVDALDQPATQSNEFGAVLVGSEARNFFEPFDYVDHGDGLITIDPGWVARNIATTTKMPIFGPGRMTCHRQMLIQLYGALSEVEAAGLAPLIDLSQYGGCWVARHIDFNPSKPISMHGWGLAVDINVSTNGLGQRPTLDPRIVEIFDRWGFVWGGRWSRPDGMHFELGAVIDVPVPANFFD
jgi:hypothetical protein